MKKVPLIYASLGTGVGGFIFNKKTLSRDKPQQQMKWHI
jgi:hypothetical protein